MAFLFALATLLRLREIAEQREERLLGQIVKQMAQSRRALADLEAQRHNLIAQREVAMRQTTSAFDITGSYGRVREVEELERTGREQLAKLAVLHEEQMRCYKASHQNRELLSSMKDDQLEAFVREQTRQEQHATDDSFSSRRSFTRQHLPGK